MYAVVEISGMQYKVSPGDKVWVPYLGDSEPGDTLTFDSVLLVSGDGDDVAIGQPIVNNARVKATLIEHTKGEKLIVFKKRRRKAFSKKLGHRQKYSVIRIDEIEFGEG